MDQTITSVAHIQATPLSPILHSIVSACGYNLRVVTQEFNHNKHLVYYSCFLWIGFAMSTAILIMAYSLSLHPSPFFVTLSAALLPLTGFAVYQRNILGMNLASSSILLNMIMITLAVLFSLKVPYSAVAFSLYLSAQTISSCCLMENNGKVLLKTLIMVQFLIICLKIDGTIGLEWEQTLIGLVILFLFLIVTSFCLFIYAFLVFWCFRQDFHEIKRIGLIFISLNLVSSGSAIGIPLWAVFVSQNYRLAIVISLICASLTALFTFLQRTAIALFLCKTQEAVSKQEPSFQLKNQDPTGMPHLYRASPNWFVQKASMTELNDCSDEEECVACMSNKATSVWQPCGHSTLCKQCMSSLIATRSIACPLCKAPPKSMVVVRRQPEPVERNLGPCEYQIVECVVVL